MRRPAPELAGTGATSTSAFATVVVVVVGIMFVGVVVVVASLEPALAWVTLALPTIESAITSAANDRECTC